jgi:rSAM/selenodomain-associated transferase 1
MPKSDPPAKQNRSRPAVGLFVKPPEPGRVKTRLIPALGAEGAAALYTMFIADLATMLSGGGDWDWFVYSTDPERSRAEWPSGAPHPAGWRAQHGADLGARLEHALEELLGEPRPAALILGSDHPTVGASHLGEAFRALAGAPIVLGPTLDGGYYLVGASRGGLPVFTGIPWSTPGVFTVTLDRLEAAGIRPAILAPWYDVDTVEDLAFLRAHLRALVLADPETPIGRKTRGFLARHPQR